MAFHNPYPKVELSDNRFRDTELWLAVGHNDIAIYQVSLFRPQGSSSYLSILIKWTVSSYRYINSLLCKTWTPSEEEEFATRSVHLRQCHQFRSTYSRSNLKCFSFLYLYFVTKCWWSIFTVRPCIAGRPKCILNFILTYHQINTFKVSIEGTDPLEMQTPEFLDIARLMKTYISIMVRRKRESTASW